MSSRESDQQQEFARLRDLCAGDGERLDLLEAAFTLSTLRRAEPLDLTPFRQHVAAMSSEVADLVRRRGATPDLLSEVIARSYAYRGDSETYDDLQNADLARVIERRKGLPVALAILYLHIARTQGWSATGLAFPGHFLIRIGMDGAQHVVDPFNEGSIRDAADLRKLLRQVAGSEAELVPAYFDSVSDRDVLLRLENNVRLRLAKREDWPGAARSLDRMLAIAPDRAELLLEAAELHARLDQRRAAMNFCLRILDLESGLVDPEVRRRASALLQDLHRGLN